MKTVRLSLILFTLLVLATCLLLFSTHSKYKNYVLEGKVEVQPRGSAVSLPVYITQNEDEIEDAKGFEQLHRVYTEEGGKFMTVFNAEVNKPIHLYVVKEGITPIRRTFTPDINKGDRQILNQPIIFTALHERLKSSNRYGHRGIPKLPTYDSECEVNPAGLIPVNEILFVENLELVNCDNATFPKLSGNIKTTKEYFTEELFSHQLKLGPQRATIPGTQQIKQD